MKETTATLLLVAVALANGNTITATQDGRQCDCDPEIVKICEANSDVDNVLLAHKYCDKFYKCSNGTPYVYNCPDILLYDTVEEKCEWPHLVDCGDRPMSPSDDASGDDCDSINDSGSDNDEPGNNDGGNDNDGGNTDDTCNCDPSEAHTICAAPDSSGILIAHENCNQFYKCDHSEPVEFTCGKNTLYNPYIEACDWASNVDCGDRIIPNPDDDNNSSNDSDDNDIDSGGNENEGTCNCDPSEAPTICAAPDSSGILIAHENCNQFYMCDHGKPVEFTCGENILYNPYTGACDWASNVDCGDRIIPDPDTNTSNDNDDNLDNDSDNGGHDDEGTCNCDPSEAPTICAAPDSSGILIAHENCNQFYKCDHSEPVEFTCGKNTLYNPYIGACDWASNVDCGDRIIPNPDDDTNSSNDSDDNDIDSGGNENEGTCNCDPSEAPTICAAPDSSGILIAHENCNQFYMCDHGKPVEFTCGENTLYNPYTGACDWASNVDCGDRVIPDPDTNSSNDNDDNLDNDSDNGGHDDEGTCNCNPSEAPTICAAPDSSGILIAHENCNQFYKCDHSEPVEFTCGKNTLYNPYIGACDWASNVDCGDRIIPNPDDDTNSSNDSDDNDIDSGGNENEGTCNCDPSEAPTICAAPDSSGILIAHENCNQFYKCDHGKPVEFTCGENTLYNPYTEACDWASNVDCGDRIIPDPDDDTNSSNDSDDNLVNDGDNDNEGTCNCDPSEAPAICAAPDSSGILIAHENCNQFYKCDHGKPVEFSCGDNTIYNPYTGECDWPSNVDCGDRIIPEADDDCACNAKNAPALCAKENSEGKFIAHENCHQYYVCVAGEPLPRFCAPTLFYNIEKEVCDWPQNVNCNQRAIVSYSSFNKHIDSHY